MEKRRGTPGIATAMLFALEALGALTFLANASVAKAEGTDFLSNVHHTVQFLPDGTAALMARLHLIEDAQHSIWITAHTFDPDRSGRLILQALAAKIASKGLSDGKCDARVFDARILIDGQGVDGYPGLDLTRLRELGQGCITLRYFRPVRHDPRFVLQGTHRKLFIQDDLAMIIGGRNVGDKYYEIHDDRNAVDRDLLIRSSNPGSIIPTAKASFAEFWDARDPRSGAPLSTQEEPMRVAAERKISAIGAEILEMLHYQRPHEGEEDKVLIKGSFEHDDANLVEIKALGEPLLRNHSPTFDISSVRFISDGPSGEPGPETRKVTPAINLWLRGTQKSLYGEQLYFEPLGDRIKIFEDLFMKGVEVTLFTNSHESFPEIISDLNYDYVRELDADAEALAATRGIAGPKNWAFFHRGVDTSRKIPSWGTHKYMIHTKNWVRDGKDSWVGSYNMDSMSAEHNAECAVIIPDSWQVAGALAGSIEGREHDDALPYVDYRTDELSPYNGMVTRAQFAEEFLKLHALEFSFVIHEL